jgi:hypothetical protein
MNFSKQLWSFIALECGKHGGQKTKCYIWTFTYRKGFRCMGKLSTKKTLYEDLLVRYKKLSHLLSIETFKFYHLQISV